jgi:hypothetical protein
LRVIKKKRLEELSKKIQVAEGHVKKIQEINLNKEEDEKLQRFDFYHVIRMEKYISQGGDPTFGNLDGREYTQEELEYYLTLSLNVPEEERYRRSKEMYYFHPSYVEMEKLHYWEDRAKANYCTGQQCVPDCPYYDERGKIEDEQVIADFLKEIEILEIEDYKKELGEDVVNSILKEWS